MTGLHLGRRASRSLAFLVAQLLIGSGLVLAATAPSAVAGGGSRPDPDAGPGGPVLVVTGDGTYGSYLLEIMRGEGLNLFAAGDTSDLTSDGLAPYITVVLGATTLTSVQVTALSDWVNAGGNLVAMRPDPGLASLLGLSRVSGTVSEGYLKVDTSTQPGEGVVGETMQFHGQADRYTSQAGTQVVATLYSDADTSTPYPAVTLHSVGSAGGSAAAFTYDLAESVVLTRQGNPAWAGQDRDGADDVVRSDDLFFGDSETDPQPDYVDLDKVDIPQADEQQRLLANVITETGRDALPLPRFWYLPRGEKAAIVMTSDNHDPEWNYEGSVASRFDNEIAASPSGCSVDDWECVRSTSYLFPDNTTLTNTQAAAYQSKGFELALHVTTGCATPTREEYADMLATQRAAMAVSYPGLDPSVTNRNHCIAWVGYTSVPEEEAGVGIRLDTNYYYWPPSWVNNRPGLFTGAGFPQRFSTVDGALIDVYQATTQMTDESGQTYPDTAEALLDAALGSQGYYGTFVANIHSDGGTESMHDDIVDAAQSRGVPIISAEQLLEWTDGRNASSFSGLSFAGGTLSFHITAATAANGLQAMLPVQGATGSLQALTLAGTPIAHDVRIVKGVEYWAFTASTGNYTATYQSTDTIAPSVVSHVPVAGATGIAVGSAVTVTFSEPVAHSSVTGSSVSLKAGSTVVPATLSVSGQTVTVTPLSSLDFGTVYTVSVSTGVTDLAGNHLAAPVSWSFTTGVGTFAAPTPAISDATPVVGQVLSADAGTWVPVPDVTAYQWVRGSNDISGANSSSYTVQSGDLGATLSVRVTGSKTGYTTLPKTSAATAAVVEGTLTSSTPTITGTVGVGHTLTADPGTWGPAPVSLAYRWLSDGTPIAGATTSTYPVTTADVGSALSVMVTGTKAGYTTASTTSQETGTIAAGTLTTATPTIDDVSPAFGQVLTAEPGSWGPGTVTLSYQWLRGGHEINAATSNTYTVTAADVGAALSVRVTGTKASYTTASMTSDATRPVAKAALSPTPAPTIWGTAVIGQVLTADPGSWGPGTVTLSYQWLRAGAEIAGATGQSYTVTAQDAGVILSVRVTGTKDGYTTVERLSAATAAVPVPVLPLASPNPTVTGVARVGMPLVASLGNWNPAPTKVTYQWYWLKKSGSRVTIKKATKATYTPTSSVQRRRLQVRIKASVSGKTLTRYSPPSGKVAAPMTGKTLKVSDTTPKVGQTLTAKQGTWKPAQTTFTYQWYARSGSGKATAIAGATTRSYLVEARFAGYKVKVKVIGAAPGYRSVTKTSGYTHKVHR